MRRDIYRFNPIRIDRIEGTSLALSMEVQEKTKIGAVTRETVIRFYEVNFAEQVYTNIGIRVIFMPLYTSIRTDHKAISEVINKFIDLHPKYAHLIR